MAIQVKMAGKKDIGTIEGIFRNPPADFRKRNIDTNLLDIGWGPERLAAQRNAGGIFVAKDSGSLVGFGMPVTYSVFTMNNLSANMMQAALAGQVHFYHGEEAAKASYRKCYETAHFVLFLPHERKDAISIYLPLLARIVEEARKMPGIRKLCGALPEMYGKIATGLGMTRGEYGGYEIVFAGKKIKHAKIDLYSPSRESDPEDIGPNEDGKLVGKKEPNVC